MSISSVSGQALYNTAKVEKKAAEVDNVKQENAQAEKNSPVRKDSFEHAPTDKPVTYSRNKLDKLQVSQLQDMQRKRTESFEQMIRSMLVKQGEKSNLTLFGHKLNVSVADSQKAAAAIAEGGEYSVDAVATRILDMAKALSGGDSSKIAELRSAVEKGFKAAGVDFGSKLPGICQDTYTEVMKRFDDWEKDARTTVE